jgi:hypothetical protein
LREGDSRYVADHFPDQIADDGRILDEQDLQIGRSGQSATFIVMTTG